MTPRQMAEHIACVGRYRIGGARWTEFVTRAERVITEALAAEREVCAKIADKKADEHAAAAKASGKGMGPLYRCKAEAARWIAQAIRTGRTEGTP
jgi:hypothetical protein